LVAGNAIWENGEMKRRAVTTILSLVLLVVPAVSWSAAIVEAPPDPMSVAPVPMEEDDAVLLALDEETAGTRPDLRVVVAAPRAAVIGKASAVLLAMRRGRVLNVEKGESVRFLAGVREAVWYRGAGLVESALALSGDPAGEGPVPLGEDHLRLGGEAPRIDRGVARVDVSFDQAGEYAVGSVVRMGVKPGSARPRGATQGSRYLVRVFEPGVLGSISGFVGRESDGSPLIGYPVLALDPADLHPVSAGRSGPDGVYLIGRLPPGEYIIAVPARRGLGREFFDDSPDAAGATPLEITPGAALGGIDLLLAKP
jgi:hypothetical protein